MSAIDTAKEFVRLGSTVGLSKDVIDLLQAKSALLTDQVTALTEENTTLLRENRNLKLENEKLKGQLQDARPKDELSEQTRLVLKYYFNKADDVSDEEIAAHFRIHLSMAGHHSDVLLKKRFIQQTRVGVSSVMGSSPPMFALTSQGREYCVNNGLTE